MADTPNRPLSRDQLAEFLKSPQAIKQFERLQQTAFATPTTIEEVAFLAGSASSDASIALGAAQVLQEGLDALASAPAVQLGDMAAQNSNSVEIAGGAIDATTIGASVPSSGAFTNLTAGNTTLGQTLVQGSLDSTGAFGCNGKPPQLSVPIATVATTGATSTTPFGYTTAAQANDIITKLNLVINALKANGIAI